MSLAVQQLGGVVADVAYVFGDLEGLHLVGWERAQQVDRRLFGGLAVDPAVEVARVQDDGHAVVDRRHQLVRLGGDDGVALQPLWLATGFDRGQLLRVSSSLRRMAPRMAAA